MGEPMKKRKQYLLVLCGSAVIVFIAAVVVRLIMRYPGIAVTVTAFFICVFVLRFTAYWILIAFAPQYIAEKRLESFIKKDRNAHILHYAEDTAEDEDAGPDISFTAALERREGLKKLVFSGKLHPETVSDILKLEKEAEFFAVFISGGNKSITLNGRLEMLCVDLNQNFCEFQISVFQVKVSGI